METAHTWGEKIALGTRQKKSCAKVKEAVYLKSASKKNTLARRGARVVEWAGLENRCKSNLTESSNLSLSAVIDRMLPGWRNWQTRYIQVVVSFGCAGSSPVPGTTLSISLVFILSSLEIVQI